MIIFCQTFVESVDPFLLVIFCRPFSCRPLPVFFRFFSNHVGNGGSKVSADDTTSILLANCSRLLHPLIRAFRTPFSIFFFSFSCSLYLHCASLPFHILPFPVIHPRVPPDIRLHMDSLGYASPPALHPQPNPVLGCSTVSCRFSGPYLILSNRATMCGLTNLWLASPRLDHWNSCSLFPISLPIFFRKQPAGAT